MMNEEQQDERAISCAKCGEDHKTCGEHGGSMNALRRYDYAIQRLLPHLWLKGFRSTESGKPESRDLVMLQSAPDSEWHLSLYIEDQGDGYHLLESLKTGKHCRWGNVGFAVISREWVKDYDHIRWNDQQFRFSDQLQAETVRAGFYLNLPFIDRIDEQTARIGFRTRHSIDNVRTIGEEFRFVGASRADLRTYLYALEDRHIAARKAERAARQGEGGAA